MHKRNGNSVIMFREHLRSAPWPNVTSWAQIKLLIKIRYRFGHSSVNHLMSPGFVGGQAWWIGVGVGRPSQLFLLPSKSAEGGLLVPKYVQRLCCHSPAYLTCYSSQSHRRERVQRECVSTVTGEAIGSGGGPPRDLMTSISLHVCIHLPSPFYVLQFKFWKEPTDCLPATCLLLFNFIYLLNKFLTLEIQPSSFNSFNLSFRGIQLFCF